MARDMWDKTMELFAKVNEFVPLDAIFWAGIAVIGVVLVLGVLGCILRKRLIPAWLIWVYFTAACLVITATPGVNLGNLIAYLEFPLLVVLICYVLRLVLRRGLRYTFVKTEVYERYVAKMEKEAAAKAAKEVNKEIKEPKETKIAEIKEVKQEVKQEVKEEVKKDTTKPERLNDDDFILPDVKPIPEKTYEPVREPAVVTTPLIKNLPEVKTTAPSRPATVTPTPVSTSASRPMNVSPTPSMTAPRPTTVTTPTMRTTTTTTPVKPNGMNNSFVSTYNPKVVTTTTVTQKPTVTMGTTTTTTTTTSSINRTNSTLNTNTVNATGTATPANSGSAKSTQDVMAAIARLRASMNNKK